MACAARGLLSPTATRHAAQPRVRNAQRALGDGRRVDSRQRGTMAGPCARESGCEYVNYTADARCPVKMHAENRARRSCDSGLVPPFASSSSSRSAPAAALTLAFSRLTVSEKRPAVDRDARDCCTWEEASCSAGAFELQHSHEQRSQPALASDAPVSPNCRQCAA